MKSIHTLLLTLLFSIIFLSNTCRGKSDDDFLCTEEFRVITIQIEGIQPDSFHTVWLSKNRIINNEDFKFGGTDDNIYPVLTDLHQKELENKVDDFAFRAFVGGKLVVNEPFKFSADRCHIFKISGKHLVTF